MSRITPSTNQTDWSQLKDYEPYKVLIKNIDWQEGHVLPNGNKVGPQMVLDWALEDTPDFTIREWVGMRLGRTADGQVSKLRMILNAIGQQPEARDIAWFDDETLEWSYDGSKAYAKLDVGLTAIVRGKTVTKQTDNGPVSRFKITAYQPAGIAEQAHKAGPPRVVGSSARPQVVTNSEPDDEDGIPF